MKPQTHRALIAEDNARTATDLAECVRSLGHEPVIATTLEEIDAAIARWDFCYVLLDKQLPVTKASAPMTETGDTAQKRLRRVDPRRNAEDHHILPILVITGASKKASFIAHNYLHGASMFIPKPFTSKKVTDEILAALRRAGREDHGRCACLAPQAGSVVAELPLDPAAPAPALVVPLVLDGIPIGMRTSFLVCNKRRDLQPALFAVLLQLAAPRSRGSEEYTSGDELGIARSPEYRSRICAAVEGAAPAGFSIVQRGEAGMYRLHPLVVVEHVDWVLFERHANPKVQRIAAAERKRR